MENARSLSGGETLVQNDLFEALKQSKIYDSALGDLTENCKEQLSDSATFKSRQRMPFEMPSIA